MLCKKMTRKQKGPAVLTAKGIIEKNLPENKFDKEKYIAETFCTLYTEKFKNTLKILSKTESPDFICIKDKVKVSLELCELVYEKQLVIDDKYNDLENLFKKNIEIPKDIFLEIINFNLDPKNIPNSRSKKGLKNLNTFIKELKSKLSMSSRIEKGKWEYYVWKFNRIHFEFRISKLPVNLPFNREGNFRLELAGINTIESKVHRNILVNLVEKKEKIKYVNRPNDSSLWLLIYSYRHFPLDHNDESVKELINKLKKTNTMFEEIWYFWPSPIKEGIIFQLYKKHITFKD